MDDALIDQLTASAAAERRQAAETIAETATEAPAELIEHVPDLIETLIDHPERTPAAAWDGLRTLLTEEPATAGDALNQTLRHVPLQKTPTAIQGQLLDLLKLGVAQQPAVLDSSVSDVVRLMSSPEYGEGWQEVLVSYGQHGEATAEQVIRALESARQATEFDPERRRRSTATFFKLATGTLSTGPIASPRLLVDGLLVEEYREQAVRHIELETGADTARDSKLLKALLDTASHPRCRSQACREVVVRALSAVASERPAMSYQQGAWEPLVRMTAEGVPESLTEDVVAAIEQLITAGDGSARRHDLPHGTRDFTLARVTLATLTWGVVEYDSPGAFTGATRLIDLLGLPAVSGIADVCLRLDTSPPEEVATVVSDEVATALYGGLMDERTSELAATALRWVARSQYSTPEEHLAATVYVLAVEDKLADECIEIAGAALSASAPGDSPTQSCWERLETSTDAALVETFTTILDGLMTRRLVDPSAISIPVEIQDRWGSRGPADKEGEQQDEDHYPE